MDTEQELAVLASNDGWTRLVLTAISSGPERFLTVLVCSSFWDRRVSLDAAKLVPDADVEVRNVRIDLSRVLVLAAELRTWVSLPLAVLAATSFSGRYEFAEDVGQTFTLTFAPVSRPGQAYVDVEVGQERLTARVRFLVDVTGCQMFVESLDGVLGLAGGDDQCGVCT